MTDPDTEHEAVAAFKREERIRHRAYELWVEAGRPAGRSAEFWDLARGEVEAGLA